MLNRKQHRNIQGFTWIELLVVIAIIGILAALALPSFLNKNACACKDPIGRFHVGRLLRAQQAFFVDQGYFASSIAEIKTDVPTDKEFYSYSIDKALLHESNSGRIGR
jgi:type IV pilus assembly protein PilA